MKKLSVNLKNCYWIKELNFDFDFEKSNVYSIYAPNGTMKTSFLKTFRCIEKWKKPIDDIHWEDTFCEIKNDDNLMIKKNKNNDIIFTIESLDTSFSSDKISTLLINDEVKEKLKNFESKKELFLNELSILSQIKYSEKSTKNWKITYVLEELLNQIFWISFIELLDKKIIKNSSIKIEIKYWNLFTSTLEKFIKWDDFQNEITNYLAKLEKIYEKNNFLKLWKFSLWRLEDIYNNLSSNKFFENWYSININWLWNSLTAENIKDKIENIKSEIETDEFKKLTSNLWKWSWIELLEFIQKNPDLVKELKLENINEFKKKIFIWYFNQLEKIFFEVIDSYNEFKIEISKIEQKKQKTKWEEIVEDFKNRFYVPFNPHIANLDKSILWIEIPNIEFQFCKNTDFHNCTDEKCYENSDNFSSFTREILDWMQVLSQWEKRALYLLNILFEIESRKKDNKQYLLIIDDIADSFDYKNKYAIIQYLFELSQEMLNIWTKEEEKLVKKFNIILLTHNFDFYRTCKSRLFIKYNFEAIKNNDGINLIEYKYAKNDPWKIWKKDLSINDIIALIPFVRNLIEYWDNEKEFFMLLTHLIHYKNQIFYNVDWNTLINHERIEKKKKWDFKIKQTTEILFWDIEKIFQKYLWSKLNFNESIKTRKIFEEIIYINTDDLDFSLQSKIIMSIKIRHESEIFMKRILWNEIVNKISWNQTWEMIKIIKENIKIYKLNKEIIKLLDDVSIMTPENIHLNSFMYEPILDMSDWHLKELYKKVSNLNK